MILKFRPGAPRWRALFSCAALVMVGLLDGPAMAASEAAAMPEAAVARDTVGRLRGHPTARRAPCPTPDSRHAIVWVLGQSNAANHAEWPDPGDATAQVGYIWNGSCY